MQKLTKSLLILFVTIIGIFASIYIYNDLCELDAECACKDSSPGDPTCMSKEGLLNWCKEQKDLNDLPQCKFGFD